MIEASDVASRSSSMRPGPDGAPGGAAEGPGAAVLHPDGRVRRLRRGLPPVRPGPAAGGAPDRHAQRARRVRARRRPGEAARRRARVVEVPEVLVRRDELLLVHATGPRGDPDAPHPRPGRPPSPSRSARTASAATCHACPGFDPVAGIRRRQPMVPLTEASIDYPFGGRTERQRLGTAVVNRDRIDFIVQSLERRRRDARLRGRAAAGRRRRVSTTGVLVGSTSPTRSDP